MGRYVYVGGGLLAPENHKRDLLAELVDYADRESLALAFFNVHEDEIGLFREYGFQVTKWGEETIVDLRGRSWQGKAFAWVRRQSHYCRRHGVVVEECQRNLMLPAAWHSTVAELSEVSAAYLATKPQRGEIRFLEGRFAPQQLSRRRLFIARAKYGQGRIEGFLLCNPCLDGTRWACETYRHRPDAVRGVSAYLMHEAMIRLAAEGIEDISLCLAPGLHCAQPLEGDSRLARWGLVLGTRYFGLILDAAGMYHFKSRFRPRYESRYLCVRPGITLAWAWTFVRTLGVLRLDLRTAAGLAISRLRNRLARRTLRTPEI
jgi:phosphatidylglycerol lysyltransferase